MKRNPSKKESFAKRFWDRKTLVRTPQFFIMFIKMTFMKAFIYLLIVAIDVSSFATVPINRYHTNSFAKNQKPVSTYSRLVPFNPLIAENDNKKIIHKSIQLHVTQSLSFHENNDSNKKIVQNETKEKDSISTTNTINVEALVFMSLLAIQFGVQPVLVRAFVPLSICKSSYVLVQECLKFVFSFLGFYMSGKEVISKSLKGTFYKI